MNHAIETVNLTKTYGKNRGIRDVNLAIRQGEIFGFLGPNGAGKSTTLRTLTGLMTPTSGSASIFGIDPHAQPVEAMRRIGNLPTEFALDDRMTGRQMIRIFGRLRRVTDYAFADELARRLDADLDRPMRRLSRGNKQKIGIVQALFHRPDVLILDEPTGGLDPLVQDSFLGLLTDARARGQTVLFSSHVLSEIERIADRVGIIREGELIAVEDPRELTGKAVRHVQFRFASPPPPDLIERLSGMRGVEQFAADGAIVRFTMRENANAILQLVDHLPLEAVDIERPTLEEIFRGFYGPLAEGGAR